jgi:hypothetical protein
LIPANLEEGRTKSTRIQFLQEFVQQNPSTEEIHELLVDSSSGGSEFELKLKVFDLIQ